VFGHKHEHGWGGTPVDGTVADSRKHGRDWSYIVYYRNPEGETCRATVPALDGHNIALPPGTAVQIYSRHSGEGKLAAVPQVGADAPSVPDAVRLARELPGQDRGAAMAAALAGLSQAGLGQPGDGVHVVGTSQVRVVGGPEVRVVGGAQAAEVREAIQGLMSGASSPAAMRERIQHLKEELQAQNGMPGPGIPATPEGFNSPDPSTFDSVAAPPPIAPTTFSSPAPAFGQPGPSFGQAGFSPVTPATTFSSPASPGSFSAGGSFGSSSVSFGGSGESKSDRIAQLEDERDRGQLVPDQFATQRQQILDEI
jgi:hypothetical protein